MDKLLNYIRYWQASGESVKTSIRTRTRLGQIVQEGRFRGGTAPYGYGLEKQGRKNRRGDEVYELVIAPDEAAVVVHIFELALMGHGGRAIATILENEKTYNRSGKKFHYSSIQNILKNITYVGILRSGESQSEVFPHLQIIPLTVFDRVQELRTGRLAAYDASRAAPMRQEGTNLLSGNIFCGTCGGRLFGSTTRKVHRPTSDISKLIRVPVYKCYNRSQHKELCDGQSVYRAAPIDETVEKIVKEVLKKARLADPRTYCKERRKQELAGITARIRRLEADYQKYLEEQKKLSGYIVQALEGNGPFTAEELKARLADLKEMCEQAAVQMEEQKEMLIQAERSQDSLLAQITKMKDYADVFDHADLPTKRMIVSAVIEKVTVSRGYHLEIKLRLGVDALLELPDGEVITRSA